MFDAFKKQFVLVKQKNKKCSVCKKEFKPFSSLDKFCSIDCKIVFGKANPKKTTTKPILVFKRTPIKKQSEKNKLQIAKYNKSRGSLNDKLKSELGVMFCEVCNDSNSALETHHIIFRSEKPNHANLHDEINLIKVCNTCHNEFHKHKGSRNELVEQRKLNELFGNDVLNK